MSPKQWLTDLSYGTAFAIFGTLLALAIMQSVSERVASLLFLTMTTAFTFTIMALTRIAARNRYAEMVRKLETLLEAEDTGGLKRQADTRTS